MSDVTRILSQIEAGDPSAAEKLLPLVYDELRKLAASKLAQETPGQTLQATALVHEAYIRLVGSAGRSESESHPGDEDGSRPAGGAYWDSRGHFFAAAAEAMRRILIDRAREKGCEKRGGKFQRVDLDARSLATTLTPDQLFIVDDALAKLTSDDPTAAQLVRLRYYAGLTVDESGQALGISTTTAYRHWNYARAWLFRELLETGEA